MVVDWTPTEVLLLMDGLPERSRFKGRLQGEYAGWETTDYLLLDLRNSVEGLRTALAGKKGKYRSWDYYPGAKAQKRKEHKAYFNRMRAMLDSGGTMEVE